MKYLKNKDMYIFSEDEKAEAHNVSVIDFLQRNYGFTFVKNRGGFRCEQHNSLFVHDDEKSWYWNSHGFGGGDVIAFVCKYENITYAEALNKILSPILSSTDITYTKAPKNISQPQERNLLLPVKKNGKYSRVFAYLTKTRCIDSNIITTLLHKKFIYEDEHSNCVFVGYNKTGLPAYASLRTTLTSRQYRREAIGSNKSNGFYLKGYDKSTIYCFEAPIDLLSHATIANLVNNNNREWLNVTRLSLGGISDNALEHYVNEYSDIKSIVFCLDNDPAGLQATLKYMDKYSKLGYKVSTEKPVNKDFNEDLQKIYSKKVNAITSIK